MTTATLSKQILTLSDALISGFMHKDIRTFKEFAEEMIMMPPGSPLEGEYFSCTTMPFTELILNIFDEDMFEEYWACGPRQTWKTFGFYVIPNLVHLFERKDGCINGVPDLDLAWEIYKERLLPIIDACSLKAQLPSSGAGSRGGKIKSIKYKNGITLRFLARGISYTSPVAMFTEADEMKSSGKGIAETDDTVAQIIECTSTFRKSKRSRIYGEGIATMKDAKVWQMFKSGTQTEVWIPCRFCGEFQFPKRTNLTGWDSARDEEEAIDKTRYQCDHCRQHWTDDDRLWSLEDPRLVSQGQSVKKGKVIGAMPKRKRFSVHWNRIHSPFITLADFGVQEFENQTKGTDDSERETRQYWWAIPHEIEIDLEGEGDLTQEILYTKISQHPHAKVPADTVKVTAHVDIGIKRHWYEVKAWNNRAQGVSIDYGLVQLNTSIEIGQAVLQGLRWLRDSKFVYGWEQTGTGNMIRPDLVLIDSGYGQYTQEVYAFVHESGQGQYFATKGRGKSNPNDPGWTAPKPGKGKKIGNNWVFWLQDDKKTWLLQMHSDYWKTEVHYRFRIPMEVPGSLSMYHTKDPREHLGYIHQVLAEKKETIKQPLKGKKGGMKMITRWTTIRVANHMLDLNYMSLVAADVLGIRVMKPKKPKPTQLPVHKRKGPGGRPRGKRIRTKY